MEIMARLVILVLRNQGSLASQPIMLELQASEVFCLKKLEKGEREKREKERDYQRNGMQGCSLVSIPMHVYIHVPTHIKIHILAYPHMHKEIREKEI